MNPSGLKLAYLYTIMNAIIMGFSFLFTKIALDFAEPMDTLTFRFAASFAVMSIPVMLGRVRLNYRGKKLRKVLLLTTLYPLGFFTLQSYGLKHATSSEGGILFAFTPVLTVPLAFLFLKETTTLLQKLSIGLSVSGVLFIFIMKGVPHRLVQHDRDCSLILILLGCGWVQRAREAASPIVQSSGNDVCHAGYCLSIFPCRVTCGACDHRNARSIVLSAC